MPPLLSRFVASLSLAALVLLAACGSTPSGVPTNGSAPPDGGTAVAFTTADGVRLSGHLFGTGSGAVVLAHMFPSNAASWYPMARRLADRGWTALAFNFRGYAESEGERDPSHADDDLRAAYRFLEERDHEVVALVGASMGGTASIVVAASMPTPVVVAISAPLNFRGLDAAAAASQVEAKTLLLASQDDEPAADSLRQLAGLLPNAEPKLFEGAAHGTNLLTDRAESSEEVINFLAEHAAPSPPAGTTPAPAPAVAAS